MCCIYLVSCVLYVLTHLIPKQPNEMGIATNPHITDKEQKHRGTWDKETDSEHQSPDQCSKGLVRSVFETRHLASALMILEITLD